MYRSYHDKTQKEIRRTILGWITRTCMAVQKEAKIRVPRATGNLGNSIMYFIMWPVSRVIVNAAYARFVEGYPTVTRRHFHSWRNDYSFRAWARRRGFDTSRDSGGLLTWGYEVPFFGSAIKIVTPVARADARRLRI